MTYFYFKIYVGLSRTNWIYLLEWFIFWSFLSCFSFGAKLLETSETLFGGLAINALGDFDPPFLCRDWCWYISHTFLNLVLLIARPGVCSRLFDLFCGPLGFQIFLYFIFGYFWVFFFLLTAFQFLLTLVVDITLLFLRHFFGLANSFF